MLKTKVREVFHKGPSSTVEWEDASGNLNRVTLPTEELITENGDTFVEDVEDGYPYGVDWESLVHTKFGPKGIASMLRKAGIWTLEDYAQNTAVVTSVFNEACSANHQAFKENVLRYGREE